MKNIKNKTIVEVDSLGLDLSISDIQKDYFDANDTVLFFKNENIELGIQILNEERKQYIVYPVVDSDKDWETLESGASIYLIKEMIEYLNQVVNNFEKDLEIIKTYVEGKLGLVRHYDLTDRKYLEKEKTNEKQV